MGAFHFGDCRLHSIEFGEPDRSRASAVFIHGRYGEAAHWEPIALGLRGAARCVCIDLPGYGFSYSVRQSGVSLVEAATLVEAVVTSVSETLGSTEAPVILVGHDIGGTIALMSAIRLARRLSGLVLINAACLTCPPSGLSEGFLARARLRRIRLHSEAERLPTRELRRQVVEPWDVRAIRRSRLGALKLFEQTWPGHYERQAWRHALTSVPCPALLLESSRDGLSPPEFARELLRTLPDAELLEHPCNSHWLPLESPHWVSSRIREFLYRVRGAYSKRA
jgi:pimeloyl-ACP methyl ester carboxylesterase